MLLFSPVSINKTKKQKPIDKSLPLEYYIKDNRNHLIINENIRKILHSCKSIDIVQTEPRIIIKYKRRIYRQSLYVDCLFNLVS